MAQDESRAHNYMRSQMDTKGKMISILADSLIEVHQKFELMLVTLYLTIDIVDQLLAMKVVPRREI